MQLETIVRAAIRDVRAGRLKPHCGDMPSWVREDEPLNDIQWSEDYAEPGYDTPKRGVLFANWNQYPSKLTDVLERAGYAIEWSDEWSTCDDCGKAVRTEANSYSWQRSYELIGECSIVCHACVDWPAYLESIEDEPHHACTRSCDPSEHGYVRLSDEGEYENGFHPGQNDSPAKILVALHERGTRGVVFRVSDVRQFDVRFETWVRVGQKDEE